MFIFLTNFYLYYEIWNIGSTIGYLFIIVLGNNYFCVLPKNYFNE